MARQWKRIVSFAAAVLAFLLVFSAYQHLARDVAIRQALALAPDKQGAPADDLEHEQTEPYRPQDEQQPEEYAPLRNEVSAPAPSHAEGDAPSGAKTHVTIPVDNDIPPAAAGGWAKPPDLDELFAEETTAPEPPAAPELSKAVIMGKLSSEDTDWVAAELSEWQRFIYVVDIPSNETSPTGFKTKVNKAKEATPYLTYLVDHYYNLPDVMVFIHAHRQGYPQAWHTDARNHDAVSMLRDAKLDFVKKEGYANLRCLGTPGCPDEVRPWRDPAPEDKLPERLYPDVYMDFFNRTAEQARAEIDVVATPCCAQFAVSREQVLKRSKEDYLHYLTYLEKSEHSDDDIGRVMEYLWHIVFGQKAVSCPDTKTCWCNLYGRCDNRIGWV